MQSEQQQRIMGYFIEEAKDHLGTIEKGLLNLQSTMADTEMISEVFRAAHSVKGGAAMLGLDSIQKTSHRLEDYFKVLKECRVKVDQKLETLLLRVFDTLQDLLEHLQGPFGLTDEKSNEVMADVEPIFGQLNAHLSTLVNNSGGDKPVDVDLSAKVAVAQAVTAPSTSNATSSPSSSQRFFQQEVAAELRNLLALFKQADTAASRQQLQGICRQLREQGQTVGADTAWAELLDTTQRAIAHPENSYRQLAPIIIKTLKQAQTLGAANRCHEIEISDALLQLCPLVTVAAIASDIPVSQITDEAFNGNEATSDAFLADLSGDDPFSDGPTENAPDEDEMDLFEDDATAVTDAPSLADSLDLIDTLDVTADDSTADTNVDELLNALDSQGADLHNQRVGPQVGPEEMDSLADLFDRESSQNLSFDWSENNTGTTESDELSDDLALDALNDFSDLLDDDTLGDVAELSASEDDISAILNTFDQDEPPLAEASQADPDLRQAASIEENLGFSPELEAEDLDNLFDQSTPDQDTDLQEDSNFGLFGDGNPLAEDSETDLDIPDSLETAQAPATTEEVGDLTSDTVDTSELDSLGAFFAGQAPEMVDPTSEVENEATSALLPNEFDGLFAEMANTEELAEDLDFADGDSIEAATDLNQTPTAAASNEDDFLDLDNDLWGDSTSEEPDEDARGVDLDLSDPWEDSIAAEGQPSDLGSSDRVSDEAAPFDDEVADLFGTDDSIALDDNDDHDSSFSLDDDETLDEASLFDNDFDMPSEAFAELDGPFGDNPLDSPIPTPAIAPDLAAPATDTPETDFNFDQEDAINDIEADFFGQDDASANEDDLNSDLFTETQLDESLTDLSPVDDTGDDFWLDEPTDSSWLDEPTDSSWLDEPTDSSWLDESTDSSWLDEPTDSSVPAASGDNEETDEIDLNLGLEDSDLPDQADFPTSDEDEDEDEDDAFDFLNDLTDETPEASLGLDDMDNLGFDDDAIALESPQQIDLSSDLESEIAETMDFDGVLDAQSLTDPLDLDGDPFSADDPSESDPDALDLSPDSNPSSEEAMEFDLDNADFDFDLDEDEDEPSAADSEADLEGVLDDMFDDTAAETTPIITETNRPPLNISGFGDSLDEAFADDDFSLLNEEPADQSQSQDELDLDFEASYSGTPDTLDDNEDFWGELETSDITALDGDDRADALTFPISDDIEDMMSDGDATDADGMDPDAMSDDASLDAFLAADAARNDDLDALLASNAADSAFHDVDADPLDPLGANDDLFDAAMEADLTDETDEIGLDLVDGENPASEFTDSMAEDDFADLDALLGEEPSDEGSGTLPQTTLQAEDEDDFADLDALLSDAEAPVAVVSTHSAVASTESSTEDDDFADLEKLLEDTDQSMGGAPTLKGDSRPSAAPARRPSPRSISNQTMRVSVKNLDDLNNMVGELVVNRNSLEQSQERLRQFLDNLLYQVHQLSDVGQRMRDLYERSLLESSLLSSRRNYHLQSNAHSTTTMEDTYHATGASFDALEMDRFTGFHTLSQEMIELIVRVRESASDIDFVVDETDQVTRMFRQVTTQLQEGLTRTRMVSFAQTADRLPRAVRDISIKCGKQAQLVVEGRDTLIDKMILEQLYDPMTHLVNNAITHGIETPQDRVEQDKNPVGTITIRSFHQGNQTIISVTDDGAGIDPEVVKRKAIAKGLVTIQEAATMTRLDVYDLLFHHGFSTRDKADDFAGRGVGMDVVRTSLSEIRGAVSIDSNIGQGTTFTIRLPLTLSISKALLCISNRASIAFPMDGVEDMLDIPKDRVQINDQGQSCILWREVLLPFRPLSDLLKFNRSLGRRSVYGGGPEDDVISVIVLRSAGNYLALQVDQVIGEQEIVIKQLESPVPKPTGIAGATVLGDGRIMPIADVLELIDLSMGRIRRESGSSLWEQGDSVNVTDIPTTTSEPTVLIVDDSITVRELLSMTFNKVGYRVEQARDGQEAWEKLRSGLPCDLVFCDIEMPRMDGLELLSRLQKDTNFNHLPIAMLTSRGADRHRQMAVQLGAKGYFTKPYLEEALLDAAQRMLKGEVLVGADS